MNDKPNEPEVTPPGLQHYAVLSQDIFGVAREGNVVGGSPAAIARLIRKGNGRKATPEDVARAAPHHFPLPED